MLITGKNVDDSAWLNRFHWWISGWCELLDGLTMIVSFGFICFNLNYHFSKWRMRLYVGRKA